MSRSSSVQVHATAVVHPTARLGAGVVVGPYAVIGADVEVGEETRIEAFAVLEGPTVLGARNRVGTGAVLGGAPQDLGYRGEPTRLVIGSANLIGPYVTVSRGTSRGGGLTRLGSGGVLDYGVHVGHDCQLGDGVHLKALAALAGHVVVGDGAEIGVLVGVHQFVHVGRLAVLEDHCKVDMDVPPLVRVAGNPARVVGFNERALEGGTVGPRAEEVRRALELLYGSGLGWGEAMTRLEAQFGHVAEVRELADFIRSSRRGVVR